MPVREIRYELYAGELEPRWVRFFAIPRFSLQAVWSKWLTTALLGFGSLQLVLYTGYLYVVNTPVLKDLLGLGNANLVLGTDRLFQSFLFVQSFIALGVILGAGPKLLSPELRHHALSIIFSRPISRATYFAGKVVAIGSLMTLLTLVQTTLLFVVMIAVNPPGSAFRAEFFSASVPAYLSAMVYAAMVTALYGLVPLAASAATANAQRAAGIIVAIIFGSSAAGRILAETLDIPTLEALGIVPLLRNAGTALLRGTSESDLSPAAMALSFFAWCGALGWFTYRRLRPVDIFEE
ncbi:MAG: hypothetical protein SF028_15850 [Candidatus Sumerlaeia bacterium]|nr:hypothetical protein [Candidatus Sumerlaeia bacterium]